MLWRRSLCSRIGRMFTPPSFFCTNISMPTHKSSCHVFTSNFRKTQQEWINQKGPLGEDASQLSQEILAVVFLQRFFVDFIFCRVSSVSLHGLTPHIPHDALQQTLMLMDEKWMVCCSFIKHTHTFTDTFCTHQLGNGTEWIYQYLNATASTAMWQKVREISVFLWTSCFSFEFSILFCCLNVYKQKWAMWSSLNTLNWGHLMLLDQMEMFMYMCGGSGIFFSLIVCCLYWCRTRLHQLISNLGLFLHIKTIV